MIARADDPAGAAARVASFRAARARLVRDLRALPSGTPFRLGKRTSNLFRFGRPHAARLEVAGLDAVLGVDPVARTADVGGMTTYERLVDATLAHGLAPLVVPELKTITLGGAVAGLGIESSSFRNGMPHESVLEMEILTGYGEVVRARPDGEHADLFFGFPNSYGSLGYALRLEIELEPVRPFVRLRHRRFRDAAAFLDALARACDERAFEGERVDFVDGVVFAPDDHVLTVAGGVEEAPATSDYTGRRIYYRSLRERAEDHLTIRDYLWRWDTDWFWCSRSFGVQRPLVRALIPRRLLRSDTYWRLVALDRRLRLTEQLDRLRGRPPREPVIQDVEIPIDRAGEFLAFLHDRVGILPVWVCPLRVRDPARSWPLYPLDPRTLYVNFGFWSSVRRLAGEPEGARNRMIERTVDELGGRKSLYSTCHYPREEFRRIYNGAAYEVLKKTYDPDGRLPDLYDKCVRGR